MKKLKDEGVLDDLSENDPLHNKPARQIIAMVDKGFAFMKDIDYKAWLEVHGPHIQFGPWTPDSRALRKESNRVRSCYTHSTW